METKAPLVQISLLNITYANGLLGLIYFPDLQNALNHKLTKPLSGLTQYKPTSQ